jgi:hypothetical protein
MLNRYGLWTILMFQWLISGAHIQIIFSETIMQQALSFTAFGMNYMIILKDLLLILIFVQIKVNWVSSREISLIQAVNLVLDLKNTLR